MTTLSPQNVESELSYAYLHAVASHAGASCVAVSRHMDNAGIDAHVVGWGPFPGGGYREEVDVNIQLKATIAVPSTVGACYSYSFRGIDQYDRLRSDAISTPRILVVLFLPPNHSDWLSHDENALSLHRCAYWVSLRGAAKSSNTTSETVYLPKSQRFDVMNLRAIMDRISSGNVPSYAGAI